MRKRIKTQTRIEKFTRRNLQGETKPVDGRPSLERRKDGELGRGGRYTENTSDY